MYRCTVASSPSAESDKTQAGLVYLCTALARRKINWELVDLSGTIEFYGSLAELYQPCDSPEWMNPESIRQADWLDEYLPSPDIVGDIVLFSAQFSPDLVLQARYSHKVKARNPRTMTAVGGAALSGLHQDQLELLASFFDHVLVGYDVERLLTRVFDSSQSRNGHGGIVKAMEAPRFQPDYSLVPLEDFVNIYTGHGCYYGRCRFCDFPSRADRQVFRRPPNEVAADLQTIRRLRPNVREAFLTQDSYSKQYLVDTAKAILKQCGTFPYSLMARPEPWMSEGIGELLVDTGCIDVFLGAEGLDDEILTILGKDISTGQITSSVNALSKFVNVTIGMILFVPGVSEQAMQAQLNHLEQLLPHVTAIEPEILTVVSGSEFARHSSRYGIVINTTENVLNDSWCFGLSQDIPWTMEDPAQIRRWFSHIDQLKSICYDKVEPVYWASLEKLADDVGPYISGRRMCRKNAASAADT